MTDKPRLGRIISANLLRIILLYTKVIILPNLHLYEFRSCFNKLGTYCLFLINNVYYVYSLVVFELYNVNRIRIEIIIITHSFKFNHTNLL